MQLPTPDPSVCIFLLQVRKSSPLLLWGVGVGLFLQLSLRLAVGPLSLMQFSSLWRAQVCLPATPRPCTFQLPLALDFYRHTSCGAYRSCSHRPDFVWVPVSRLTWPKSRCSARVG